MKKMILFAALLVALSATAASAAGVSVNWGNACWGVTPVSSLTWACTNNTFTGIRMTCTFKPAQDKTNFVGVGVFMEGVTNSGVLTVPDWWKRNIGECNSLTISSVTVSADGSSAGCVDVWAGGGGGGLGLYSDELNRTHINAAWASADPLPILAADENFALQFRVSAAKSSGTGLCAGCDMGMTWGLQRIDVGYAGQSTDETLDVAYGGGNQCLSYNGGNAPCAQPVPARNTTWGQVKSLYR